MIEEEDLKVGDYVLLKPEGYSWELLGDKNNRKNTIGKIIRISPLLLRVKIISAKNQERVNEIKYKTEGWIYYKKNVIKVLSKLEVFGEIL